MDTREFAIMIINGEVYTGEFHSQILNKYLKDYNAMLSNSIKRFKPNNVINNQENDIHQLAFAHFTIDKDTSKEIIYLETGESLQNMTPEEAASILKQKWPNAEIRDDCTIETPNTSYKLYDLILAKKDLRKNAYDSVDIRDILLTPTPLYGQDYFKQRDPELLKKNKELHEHGEYRNQDSIDGLNTLISKRKSRLKR